MVSHQQTNEMAVWYIVFWRRAQGLPPTEERLVEQCHYGGAPDTVRARCGDLVSLLDPAAAASAVGAPCLEVLSLVRDTLEFNHCTKLFHQTVHALSAGSCKMRHYTNVVSCPLKISQPQHVVPKGHLYLGGILGGVSKPAPYG